MSLMVYGLALLGLVGCMVGVVASDPAQAETTEQAAPQARVLIDRSIEFLFVYDVLGDFLRRTGYQVTSNRATLTPKVLDGYDIIVLQQLTTPLQFSDDVIAAVQAWVEAGGRLVLFGQAVQWDKTNRLPGSSKAEGDFPLNRVAARFGFCFLSSEQGEFPLHNQSDPIMEGVPELDRDTYDPRARLFGPGWMDAYGVGLISIPDDAKPLITDARGRVVMAMRKVGKGEVVVCTGKRTLWGLTRPPEPQNTEVARQLFGHLFAYLSRGIKPRPGVPPVPETILPDKQIVLNGMTVTYAGPLKARAEFLAAEFPRMYREMKQFFGAPPLETIHVEALPGAGGGWTAGSNIGIGVTGNDDDVCAVLLWEMTNAWKLPSGPGWIEVWARLTTYLMRERLDIYSPGRQAQDQFADWKALLAVDPDLKKIDVSQNAPNEVAHRQKVSKVALMLLRLHARYGDEFIHRLVHIHRAQHGAQEFIGMDDLIVEMSQAAHENLFSWFAAYGTTVHPRPLDLGQ
jgi:hypothetical protein